MLLLCGNPEPIMFSYYGSKSKVVGYYPKPKYDKVIEPFAGSARYSLKWFENEILLVDKYDLVVDVWHYLQQVDERELLKLSELNIEYRLSDVVSKGSIEYNFMGFLVQAGQGKPADTLSSMRDSKYVKKQIKWIASNLFKIRHWEIICGDYKNLENKEATWFIDPPYFVGGEHQYKFSNKQIDYGELAEWCKDRRGQVIVCENSKADWLPFRQMADLHGTKYKTKEVIWSNQQTVYDYENLDLFG